MNAKIQALRIAHREALTKGKRKEAASIRQEIRDTARQAFDKGATLAELL